MNNIIEPLISESMEFNLGFDRLLEQSLLVVPFRLQKFAEDADFAEKMAIAFGDNINFSSLQEKWTQGKIIFPTIEVRSHLTFATHICQRCDAKGTLLARTFSQNVDHTSF